MNRGNKRTQTLEQLRSAANDAIAFLHSMVKLVDARGWREVHSEFTNCVLCTADTILAPDQQEWRDQRVRVDGGSHVAEMFETFKRVPTPVFKGVLMLIERELRKDVDQLIERISNEREISKAGQAA